MKQNETRKEKKINQQKCIKRAMIKKKNTNKWRKKTKKMIE